MELAKQVTSLDVSKEIQKLNFRKRTTYRWKQIGRTKEYGVAGYGIISTCDATAIIPAYTASELMEYLPDQIQLPYKDKDGASLAVIEIHKQNGFSYATYVSREQDRGLLFEIDNLHIIKSETLADALGLMLIYLLEHNLIDGNTNN